MKLLFKSILLILWMGIIFYFSHQSGHESAESSQFIIRYFKVNLIFGQYTSLVIRKAAHVFEYFILSLLFYQLLKDFFKHPVFFSIFYSFLYACTDEIHQLYVINRGPNIYDVLIDTVGAILAMILIILMQKIKYVR